MSGCVLTGSSAMYGIKSGSVTFIGVVPHRVGMIVKSYPTSMIDRQISRDLAPYPERVVTGPTNKTVFFILFLFDILLRSYSVVRDFSYRFSTKKLYLTTRVPILYHRQH